MFIEEKFKVNVGGRGMRFIYVKLNYVEQCVSNRNEVKNEVHMG